MENKIDFQLPKELKCALPTEKRGLARDEVRLMVSNRKTDKIHHAQFKDIGSFLQEGDVLVVNTSATLPAALDIQLPNGEAGRIHLSTRKSELKWVVEIRSIFENATHRYNGISIGNKFRLPKGGQVTIQQPFYKENHSENHLYLWEGKFDVPIPMEDYLIQYGKPIRYDRLSANYPLDYYQTVFSSEMGSSEMPSAGRAFTPELVAQLIIKGIQFAPILLHTGVSSLESNEQPYPEFYKISETAASLLNLAKKENRRIIAVGTTAVRALESATNNKGRVMTCEGWTNLCITPERGMRITDGLLTGFHEPSASHLLMLGALANLSHLQLCYDEALKQRYHWHEFGDLHLIL